MTGHPSLCSLPHLHEAIQATSFQLQPLWQMMAQPLASVPHSEQGRMRSMVRKLQQTSCMRLPPTLSCRSQCSITKYLVCSSNGIQNRPCMPAGLHASLAEGILPGSWAAICGCRRWEASVHDWTVHAGLGKQMYTKNGQASWEQLVLSCSPEDRYPWSEAGCESHKLAGPEEGVPLGSRYPCAGGRSLSAAPAPLLQCLLALVLRTLPAPAADTHQMSVQQNQPQHPARMHRTSHENGKGPLWTCYSAHKSAGLNCFKSLKSLKGTDIHLNLGPCPSIMRTKCEVLVPEAVGKPTGPASLREMAGSCGWRQAYRPWRQAYRPRQPS